MNKEQLVRSQSLFNKSIEMLEIDIDSSLFISRKNFEMVVHSYYEINGLKKRENSEKYPNLYWMTQNLKDLKKISGELFNAMDYVRDKGNLAVHNAKRSSNPSVAEEIIRQLAKILVWYFRDLGNTSNTYYLMLLNKAQIDIEEDNEAIELFNAIVDLYEFKFYKNSGNFENAYDTFEKYEVLDEDLTNLVNLHLELLDRFGKFDENYTERNVGFRGVLDTVLSKKNPSAKEIFQELNSDKIYELKKLKEKIYDKYF